MLAPATAALAQAVAETRGRPPTTAPWRAQPLAAPARTVQEFQVSPATPASEALRGSPPWAFPPQTQGPGFMPGPFSGHNVYYRVLAYFAAFARKVPEGALRSSLSGDERLYSGQ